eukprot:scaffold699_cov385-Prasinococcus_capsulatus_cf.AAC.31
MNGWSTAASMSLSDKMCSTCLRRMMSFFFNIWQLQATPKPVRILDRLLASSVHFREGSGSFKRRCWGELALRAKCLPPLLCLHSRTRPKVPVPAFSG